MENNFCVKSINNIKNMKKENKNILLEEHLRKIKYRMNYTINESPKYNLLVNNNEEFDAIPNMSQEGQPVPMSQSLTNEADAVDDKEVQNIDNKVAPELPSGETNNMSIPEPPTPSFDDENVQPPIDEPEQQVDTIQNEIIKHNLEAMKSIHDELEKLSNVVGNLNSKVDDLNSEVDEIREPSNYEKLTNKSEVSYPYYFNLNDMWSQNWFNEKMEVTKNTGIRELPDGTYIADFDDLPKSSNTDISNSFI